AFHAAMGYADVVTLKEVGLKWDQWLDLHLMQKFL
ncbi:MAG: GNAT family N-acetyltransferase, partial [Pseudomonadota bacterium]